jgi:phosphate starvation-inducible PhoH-like protein
VVFLKGASLHLLTRREWRPNGSEVSANNGLVFGRERGIQEIGVVRAEAKERSIFCSNKENQMTGYGRRAGDPKGATKEMDVRFPDASVLQALVGDKDENLKVIERELSLKIGRSPEGLVLVGQDTDVELGYSLLTQLRGLIEQGEVIFKGDVDRAIKMLSGNQRLQLSELFRDQIRTSGKRTKIVPKTFKQKTYIEEIKDNSVVFGVGPAGTGKTYLAMAMAVSALVNKEVKRIVLCRPAVEAGEKLGFLPGDMAEKVNPYLRPLYDALHDMVDVDRAKEMVEKGVVEVAPLAFMRGRTLSNAFVILDEAQNTTPVQMKMFLTRLGFGSTCVVTGDPTQIDLPRGMVSGLTHALKILNNTDGVSIVHFTDEDVVRHPLVSRIIQAYDRDED